MPFIGIKLIDLVLVGLAPDKGEPKCSENCVANAAILRPANARDGRRLPAAGDGHGQVVFPHQANGSLIVHEDKTVGSELIGQSFDDPNISGAGRRATSAFPNDASSSPGATMGRPIRRKWTPSKADSKRSKKHNPNHRRRAGRTRNGVGQRTRSPDQPRRRRVSSRAQVAKAHRRTTKSTSSWRRKTREGRTFGILGEPRVNVLQLNLALDARFPAQK